MAKKKIPPRRKKRTREHVIADLSVNFVERHILLCGHSVERIVHDYGIDLFVHTYNDEGEVEPGRILFQLKATDHLKLVEDGTALAFQVEMADLRWWLQELMPVILVLYDAQADTAYWIYIQDHYADKATQILQKAQKHLTVHIPLTNRLDSAVIQQLALTKQAIVQKLGKLSHHE